MPATRSIRPPVRSVDPVMLEQRAAQFTRRSIKTASKIAGLRLALAMLDLTTLEGKDSPEKVRALCRKAVAPSDHPFTPPLPSVAAVCVYPALVPVAVEALRNSSVRIASVATGFPSGQYPLHIRLQDVRDAVAAGAHEIDMVINRGAFLAGRFDEVADEIRAFREAAHPAHLKIIFETGELETYDRVRAACDLALEACWSTPNLPPPTDGEVFLKTSTGKVTPAATLPVTLLLCEAARDQFRATGVRVGIKPAGGIRAAKTALHYLVMVKETLGDDWLSPHLFRFGASTLLNDILRQLLKQATGQYTAAYDVSEA